MSQESNTFAKQINVVDQLKDHGNITRAAKNNGVTARTIHRWRESNSLFDAACDKAITEFKRD